MTVRHCWFSFEGFIRNYIHQPFALLFVGQTWRPLFELFERTVISNVLIGWRCSCDRQPGTFCWLSSIPAVAYALHAKISERTQGCQRFPLLCQNFDQNKGHMATRSLVRITGLKTQCIFRSVYKNIPLRDSPAARKFASVSPLLFLASAAIVDNASMWTWRWFHYVYRPIF